MTYKECEQIINEMYKTLSEEVFIDGTFTELKDCLTKAKQIMDDLNTRVDTNDSRITTIEDNIK